MALHFVGFRDGSQLWRAMQIWGIPDFIHRHADFRLVCGGELDEDNDTIVFAEDSRFFSLEAIREFLDWYQWEHQNDPEWQKQYKKLLAVDDSSDYTSHYRKLTGSVPW